MWANPQSRILPLFALAWAGASIAYIPFLTILLPVRIETLAGVTGQSDLAVTWIGTFAFAGAIAASIGGIAFGWASDVLGSRRIWVAAGLILSAGLLLLTTQMTTFVEHIVLLTCWQLALNMMIGPLSAWAGDLVPDSQKGKLGGMMAFAPAAGALTGALVTVPGMAGPEMRIFIVAVLQVCCVAPLLFFGSVSRVQSAGPDVPPDRSDLPQHAVLLRMWVARLMVQVSEATLFAYLYVWLRSLDPAFDDSATARIFGGMLAVAVPLTLFVGAWADRHGKPLLPLRIAAALASAALLLMGATLSPVVAIVGYAVFNLCSSVFLALHAAQTLRVLQHGDRRGRDMGVFNLTNTLPSLIMPALTITLIPALGFRGLFVLLALLAAGAAILLAPSRRR